MKNLAILSILALAVAGCSGGAGDQGAPPPPPKPMSQAEIDAMPPEARAAMEAAKQRGAEMARTQGKPVGGQ